jgi:Tol biopolymer transport system component
MAIVRGDNIFTVAPDGSNQVQLTQEANSNFANNPAFSPDGSQLAYVHHIAPTGNEWGGAELHVMKADGSDDKVLVPSKDKGERAENPSWAPDGKSIYFAHDVPIIDASNKYTGDKLTVEKVDLASGQRTIIVPQNGILPAASTTGQLVWVNYDPTTSNFQMMIGNADGSNGKPILSQKDFQAVLWPVVSPDGKTIAFSGSGRTNSTVATLGSSIGALLNPLLPGVAEAHGLPWDPWIIGVVGKGLKKLASLGTDEQAITWSPDGRELAMANLSSTFLLRADGSGFNRIFSHGDPGGISWKR